MMKRVVVFGKPGGGKSTLSKNLSAVTGIKLCALDLIEYKELERYDLVRFKSSDGEWVTQSLKSISKQASSGVPTCN